MAAARDMLVLLAMEAVAQAMMLRITKQNATTHEICHERCHAAHECSEAHQPKAAGSALASAVTAAGGLRNTCRMAPPRIEDATDRKLANWRCRLVADSPRGRCTGATMRAA